MSSSTIKVAQPDAIELIRIPIENKAAKMTTVQRRNIVLAIDVTHAGVLADRSFRDAYVLHHGCPVAQYGFASVWIVGPHAEYCGRLGNGSP